MRVVDLAAWEADDYSDIATLMVFTTQEFEEIAIKSIKARYPDIQLLGARSFQRVLVPEHCTRGSYALAFEKKDGVEFEVCPIDLKGVETEQIVEYVSEHCSLRRDNVDAKSQRVWLFATPGIEEQVMLGVQAIFGERCPIIGGTAAHDYMSSPPYILCNEGVMTRGVIVARLINSGGILTQMLGGFLPTLHKGVITRSVGRVIYEIDDRPALDVYNEWTEYKLNEKLRKNEIMPNDTGIFPLAVVHTEDGLQHAESEYFLAAVGSSNPSNGSLSLFAQLEQGGAVTLMRGSAFTMLVRVRRAIEQALDGVDPSQVASAILLYCAGCGAIVLDRLDEVEHSVRMTLGMDVPFIGALTFGEQGQTDEDSCARHANLMCSVLLFMK